MSNSAGAEHLSAPNTVSTPYLVAAAEFDRAAVLTLANTQASRRSGELFGRSARLSGFKGVRVHGREMKARGGLSLLQTCPLRDHGY